MENSKYHYPTPKELYDKVNRYYPFVRDVFNYLNGYINPANPCSLNITLYSIVNYAEYIKPNMINFYIGNVVQNFYHDDSMIKKITIQCIAHELSHANQICSMIMYSKDPYYKKMVEDSNEAYTEIWINNHSDEIYNKFGIKMTYSKYAIETIQPNFNYYQSFEAKGFYFHVIMDVIYRNETMQDNLAKLFNGVTSIIFHINDSDSALIKYRGEYNKEGIPMFSRIVNKYCRGMNGPAIKKFKKKTNTKKIQIYDDINGLDFHLVIFDEEFNPLKYK